jgi:hypothetical protein
MHNPPFQEVARVDQEGVGGPTRCGAKCSRKMRIVSLIDEEDVIERILRHLGLGQERVLCIAAPTRPRGARGEIPSPCTPRDALEAMRISVAATTSASSTARSA